MEQLLENEGKLMENEGKLLENEGNVMENEGKLIENECKLVENEGKLIENEGKLLKNEGKLMENGRKLIGNQKAKKILKKKNLKKNFAPLEKAFFRKVTRVKRCSAQKPVDQLLDIRSDGANRWQTQQKTETTIEMTARCAKPCGC